MNWGHMWSKINGRGIQHLVRDGWKDPGVSRYLKMQAAMSGKNKVKGLTKKRQNPNSSCGLAYLADDWKKKCKTNGLFVNLDLE